MLASEAVMVADPALAPVIVAPLTVATPVLEDDQVTLEVMSRVDPSV
jgi:hypothetical protein